MAFTLNRDAFSLCMVLLLMTAFTWSVVSTKVGNTTAHTIFKQWMAQHGISYKDAAEREKRFEIFQEKLRYIEDFNSAGNRTYQLGLNEFSDLTTEEFLSRYTEKVFSSESMNLSEAVTPYNYTATNQVPDEVNWVFKGALNRVKNQGKCGCCWAFSAVGAIEAAIKIKTDKLLRLSEQELVDCDLKSNGCKGGYFTSAFQYVVKYGITSEADYPYLEDKKFCKRSRTKRYAKLSGWTRLPENNETEIMKAVAQQPVAARITVTQSFRDYKTGIFNDPACTDVHNHCVVIVGYGKSKDGTKFWLLRNSWGPSWGAGGYMRIAREVPGHPHGVCGLAIFTGFPY